MGIHSMRMHSFVALLILVTDFQVIIAKETRALSCSYAEYKGIMMREYDRKKVIEAHNLWRRDLAKGEYRGYPPAKNMQFVVTTNSHDLNNFQ
ncbi:hypothetical protein KIN20_024912 [Parelaphostrongylus tenuis]|uniref:SCP domain-containing protein n=1 Tax=Parelaphostrongylus tenuis TaxID=148309 RepID=A0AAD5MU86_PARTN|nr:hypothetical protein KIN20_024912 [Parelaphostrongylus tenuis]